MDLYNLYMAIVPDEYLPTLTQKQLNINPSLPIFKDEILKKEIDKQKAKMGIKYFETGSGKSKYLAFYLDPKTKAYHDFFTREKIVNYDGTDLNEEYRKKIDYVNKNEYEELRFLENSINTSDISLMEFDYYFPELRYLFTYMSTYGDFIDFYQKIPLDQQIDYSFYDFSKSPIIDQYDPAWFADRPAFVPTPVPTPSPVPTPAPTPPPYQELTLGSRGQAVLDMKGRFFELGYFRTTEFSDQFNKNTADTVRLFEKNNGLPADGVADPTMLALLFSDGAVGK